MKRRFKIIETETSSWSTSFAFTDLDHKNKKNQISGKAFPHHLGRLAEKSIKEINGLLFTVELAEGKPKELDPLELCDKIIGSE